MNLKYLKLIHDEINLLLKNIDIEGIKINTIRIEILNKIKLIFKYYNSSILSAEYLYTTEFNEQIKRIHSLYDDFLNDIYIDFEVETTNINNEEIIDLKTKVYKLIRLTNESYNDFENNLINKHKSQEFEAIIFLTKDYQKEIENLQLDDEINDLYNLFQSNILITTYDHFQSDKISRLTDLIKISDELNNFKNKLTSQKDIINILNQKVVYLIFKWNIRRKCFIKDSPFIVNSEINEYFKGKNIIEISEDDFKFQDLNNWKTYILNHYQINTNWNYKINNDYNRVCKNGYLKEEPINFQKCHLAIKYHKDVSLEHNLLKSIKDSLIKIDTESINNEYDKVICKLNVNYCINNYFSSFVENENHTIQSIIDEYNNCKNITYKIENNFFLEYKLLFTINERIEKDKNLFESLDEKLVNEIITIFEKYKFKIRWSKTNQKFIFGTPIKQSFIEIENKENNDPNDLKRFFIASSFILPLDSKDVENKFEYISNIYSNFKHKYQYSKEIKNERIERNKLIEENKQNERKAIEIISIFTGIITFIFTAVPTFKFIHTFYQAVLFTISTGASLGLFVLLILIFTKGLRRNKESIYLIIGIVTLLIFTSISLLSFEKNHKLDREKNIELIKSNKDELKFLKNYKDSVESSNKIDNSLNFKDSIRNFE